MSSKSLLLCLFVLGVCVAKPADNEQLDKATVNDVAANAVVAQVTNDKQTELLNAAESTSDKKDNSAHVQITGITTGIDQPLPAEPENPPTTTPFKPQRAGTMFARFIDDIFQIPINVLQNVAKLITSPFVQTKKDPAAASS